MEFKIGDLVVPNGNIEYYEEEFLIKEYYVIVGILRNKIYLIDDYGNERGIFNHRFDLYKEREMEIIKGSTVVCIDSKGSSWLEQGLDYVVCDVSVDKLLISGYWLKRSRFQLVDDKKLIPKPSLLRELNKLVEKDGHVGTCSYALEFESGHRRFQHADVCHARIAYPYYNAHNKERVIKNLALHIRGHAKKIPVAYGELREELYWFYVDYILNRSPWSSMFVGNKSIEDIKKEGGVYVDVSRGINEIASAAIALRMGSEFPYILNPFYLLCQSGCNEHFAWLFAQHFPGTANVAYKENGGGHSTIDSSLGFKQYMNTMYTGVFLHPGIKYTEAIDKGYIVCGSMADFGNKGNPPIDSVLLNLIKDFKHVDIGFGQKVVKIPHVLNLVPYINKLEEEYKKM
jgi:hypothetical protein